MGILPVWANGHLARAFSHMGGTDILPILSCSHAPAWKQGVDFANLPVFNLILIFSEPFKH
jgi:hypothetical protein